MKSVYLCCLHAYYLFFFFSQEFVEVKHVENTSDTEGYPSLEGHYRAASLPRLNAEYYVSSAVLTMMCFLILLFIEKYLIGSFMVAMFELHSCDNIRCWIFRHCGYLGFLCCSRPWNRLKKADEMLKGSWLV